MAFSAAQKAAYYEKLKDPRWQKMRLEVMQRDEFTCQGCLDATSTLNVHHLIYSDRGDPWDVATSSLITLCESCHEYETDRRRASEWELVKALRALRCLSGDFDAISEGFAVLLLQNPDYDIHEYTSSAIGWFVSDPANLGYIWDAYNAHIAKKAKEPSAE